jgi:zinc/manganese transport system substrate-binding protein
VKEAAMTILRALSMLLLAGLALAAAPHPAEPLKVIATTPTYGALAREIGGELVDVVVLCRCGQDLHAVSATPSLMGRLHDADLLLYTGLEAELWLDPMLRGSGNLELLPGNPGAVMMSDGVPLKEVPAEVSRRQGDVHAFGNPHVWADPLAVRIMAAHVADALAAALPEQAEQIRARQQAFHERLTHAVIGWLKDYAALKGAAVVTYHTSWPYFLERFGLVRAGTIEPKPRVAPTPSHLQDLIETMQARQVRVIIREPYQAPDAAAFVAEATGATVVELSTHPGCPEGTEDIVEHFQHNLDALAAALGVTPGGTR